MARFVDLTTQKIEHEEFDQEAVDLTPELEEVTELMYEAELAEKEAKQQRSTMRGRFFELLTQYVRQNRPLAVETVELSLEETGESVDDVNGLISRHYPEWQILNVTRDEDGWVVTIQENPAITKATFTNQKLGKVFGRTYELRGGSFDAAGLVDQYPDLADLCVDKVVTTRYRAGNWKGEPEISVTYEFDEEKATKIVGLDPETLHIFQQFTIMGKLNTKLTPTRSAKEIDQS